MEVVLFLLAMVIVFAGVIGVILGVVALVKIKRIQRARLSSVHELNIRLRKFELRLVTLEGAQTQTREPASEKADAPVTPSLQKPSPKVVQQELAQPTQAPEHPKAKAPQIPVAPPPLPKPKQEQVIIPEPEVLEDVTSVSRPGTPTMSPPPPRSPMVKPAQTFDLEKWLGVRGAAVLGGIVLALAGIYLFKYSIEQGLLAPPLRVGLGLVTGIACLVGSHWLRRRAFSLPANGLAGGGLVILYGSVWAAFGLYHLIHSIVAFLAMVVVTAVCGMLAIRYQSRFVALLGLFGGFVTPIMVSTGDVRTLQLFGYLFLLNIGLLVLGKKMAQPVLGYLSLLATGAYQAYFLLAYLEEAGLWVMMGIVVLFGLFFSSLGLLGKPGNRSWVPMQVLGLIMAFTFGLIMIPNQAVVLTLGPLSLMLACLSAGAAWLSFRQEEPVFIQGAGFSTAGVLWYWYAANVPISTSPWAIALILSGVVALYSLFLSLARERIKMAKALRGFSQAFWILVLAVFPMLVLESLLVYPTHFLAWLTSWLLLSGMFWWHARASSFPVANLLVGLGLGMSFGLFLMVHGEHDHFPSLAMFFGVILVIGVSLLLLDRWVEGAKGQLWARRSAAIFPLLILGSMIVSPRLDLTPGWIHALLMGLAFFSSLGCGRSGSGKIYFGLVLVTLGAFWSQTLSIYQEKDGLVHLGVGIILAGFFSYFPFFMAADFKKKKWVWASASLATVFWFPFLGETYERVFGGASIGLLPVGLALLTFAGALRCQRESALNPSIGRAGLIWFAGVTVGFVTLALPLQLDKSWLTVAFAMETLALLLLWIRLNHPGLKWTAFALFSVVAIRLVLNSHLLDYYPQTEGRIFTWLMYTYLIPVVAFLIGAHILGRREVARLQPGEKWFYHREIPLLSGAMVFGVVVIFFVYLNLAVFQYFSGSGQLELGMARQPARDLTLSMVWACYGLVLMTIGIRGRIKSIRRLSLAMLILTICKVFLYDLGELTDLYRAASLFGLAMSLLAVSVAYQKFVTNESNGEDTEKN